MQKGVQFFIFVIVFLFVYFLMNFYPISRVFHYFDLAKGPIFYGIILFLTVSLIASAGLERVWNNPLTRGTYYVIALWTGVLLFFITFTFIFDMAYLLIPMNKLFVGIMIIAFTLIFSVYSVYNANDAYIKQVDIKLNGLEKNTKIVQLSDLHIGAINNAKYIDSVITKTNSLNPDVVVITGDLFDSSASANDCIGKALKKINAKTYFVTGNHEVYEGVETVIRTVENANITILDNKKEEINGLQIAGWNFGDLNKNNFKEKAKSLNLNKSKPALLIYHTPDIVKPASEIFDVQLYGHTHNGQIFPFTILVKIAFPYIKGYYHVNSSHVYVSPGTGTWGPKMRFGSRSEITLINLTNENS